MSNFRLPTPGAPNYYQILGVRQDAPLSDIRRAYKQVALHVHPDRITNSRGGARPGSSSSLLNEAASPLFLVPGQQPDSEDEALRANERFKLVGEAYAVLGDEELRQLYDTELLQQQGRASPAGFGFASSSLGTPTDLPAEDNYWSNILDPPTGGVTSGHYAGLGGDGGRDDFEDSDDEDDSDGYRQRKDVPMFDDEDNYLGEPGAATVTSVTGEDGFSAFFDRENTADLAGSTTSHSLPKESHSRGGGSSSTHQRRASISTPLGRPPLSRQGQDSRGGGATRTGTGEGARRMRSPGAGKGRPPTAPNATPQEQPLPSTPVSSLRREGSAASNKKATIRPDSMGSSGKQTPSKKKKKQSAPSSATPSSHPSSATPGPRRDYVPEEIQEALLAGDDNIDGSFSTTVGGSQKQKKTQQHNFTGGGNGDFMFEETSRLYNTQQPHQGAAKQRRGGQRRGEAQPSLRPGQEAHQPEAQAPELVEANELWDKTYQVDPRSGKVSRRPVSRVSGTPVVAPTSRFAHLQEASSSGHGGARARATSKGLESQLRRHLNSAVGGAPDQTELPGIQRSASSFSYFDQWQHQQTNSHSPSRHGASRSGYFHPPVGESSAWQRRQEKEEEMRSSLRSVGGRRRRTSPTPKPASNNTSTRLSPIRTRMGTRVGSRPELPSKEDTSTKRKLHKAHRRTLDIFFS